MKFYVKEAIYRNKISFSVPSAFIQEYCILFHKRFYIVGKMFVKHEAKITIIFVKCFGNNNIFCNLFTILTNYIAFNISDNITVNYVHIICYNW